MSYLLDTKYLGWGYVMEAYEIKMKVPHEILISLHKSLDEVAEDIRIQAAVRYYKKRFLSLGKAADLAGMTRIQFIDYLRFSGEYVFDYNENELDEIKEDAVKLGKLLDE
jgi:predicted HTH domain antitoxin